MGVIASERKLSNLVPLLNVSLVPYTDKLTFFVNNPYMNENALLETTPSGINVVNFNDEHDNLLPFHALKYIQDNYMTQYDWFFLVSDSTFVRAAKLNEAINHISISQELYMGFSLAANYSLYCSLASGIIFSNVLKKI